MVKIFTVVLVIAISGCAIFDGRQIPKITLTAYEGDGHSKPSLSYSSIASRGLFSVKELPEVTQSIIEGELLSVLTSSEYFGRISKKDESADISIDVNLTNSENPEAMIPAMITGYSLYTIPSWATNSFKLVVKVERKDGLIKEYILTDSTTIVQWLPMIFVFPVKNLSVVTDVRKNMYKKVLSNMQKDGFFDNEKTKLSLVHY